MGGLGHIFAPSDLSGLTVWLRGDLGVTTVSSNVSVWADQSGNGNHFRQSNATLRPAYNSNPLNGQATLTFASANNLLCDNYLLDPKPRCFVAVFVEGTVSGTEAIYSGDAALYAPLSSGANIYNTTETATLVGSTAYAYIANSGATTMDQWLNGTEQAAITSYTNSNRGATRIGCDAGGAAQFWHGDLAEFMIYNRTLTATEITKVRNYVTARYGFSA